MKTVSQTTHGSETRTTTEPFNANVTYSDGSSATVQGEQTTTVVVPTETTISRSSVAVYMYTYRVKADQLELISTDNVVFSRVMASGSGDNAAGAELGAGIGNLIRKSKDRHRADKLFAESLKAILAEVSPNTVVQEGKSPDPAATNVVNAVQSVAEAKPSETTAQSPQVQPLGDMATEGISSITSEPDGADIFIDSVGRGRTPTLVRLKPGKHSVQVVYSGYQDWVSEIEVRAGSIVNVTATLQK
jgi:hypothetical protein